MVPDGLDGARLDKAALALAPGIARAEMKRAIAMGAVRVNGRACRKGANVSMGDVLTIDQSKITPRNAAALPEPEAALLVRYESKAVLLVDKPAGQPTAPLRAIETGTLANVLVGRYPELAGIGYGPREPGLVNRLDTDTSGLVLVARTGQAFLVLKAALKSGELHKSYLLVCAADGLPERGTIEYPLAKHPKDQRRVLACIHPRDVTRYAARPARTEFRVQRRLGDRWALVEASVSRALRHQVRAHFAAAGHPLAGDLLYGGDEVPGLRRHALHAAEILFEGGGEVEAFDVRSPLPEAFAVFGT